MVERSPAVRQAEALIERLATEAMDDGYLATHERPPGAVAKSLSFLISVLFGVLLAVAALRANLTGQATELENQALVDRIEVQTELNESRRAAVAELRTEIESLAEAEERPSGANLGLNVASGAVALTGAGITIEARSGEGGNGIIDDRDLQMLVNGLWQAGAEAISINGQRIGATSAIHWAGSAVVVNFTSLAEPYRVVAIGPSESLAERIAANTAGRYWDTRASSTGLSWVVTQSADVRVPALPQARQNLRHAQAGRS